MAASATPSPLPSRTGLTRVSHATARHTCVTHAEVSLALVDEEFFPKSRTSPTAEDMPVTLLGPYQSNWKIDYILVDHPSSGHRMVIGDVTLRR